MVFQRLGAALQISIGKRNREWISHTCARLLRAYETCAHRGSLRAFIAFIGVCTIAFGSIASAFAQSCADTVPATHDGWTMWGGPQQNVSAAVAASHYVADSFDELKNAVEQTTYNDMYATFTNFSMTYVGGYPDMNPMDWTWTGTMPDGSVRTSAQFGDSLSRYAATQPRCPAGYTLQGDLATCQLTDPTLQSCGTRPNPPKNRACNKGDHTSEGNPCNVATGIKSQVEVDYESAGPLPLRFARYYSSDVGMPQTNLGPQWRGEFDRKLILSIDPRFTNVNGGPVQILLYRPNGNVIAFTLNGTTAQARDGDTVEQLVQVDKKTWQLQTADDSVETYVLGGDFSSSITQAALTSIRSRAGVMQTLVYAPDHTLRTVTDSFGRSLSFTYDAQQRLSTLTDPSNNVYHYAYDTNGNLSSVTYADNSSRQYQYNDSQNVGALTAIVDESTHTFASWTYDNQRRAISSQHAGGAEQVNFTFNADGTTSVSDAAGGQRIYGFNVVQGVPKASSITQSGASFGASYDTNGFPLSITDRNGHQTRYQYNTRGLQLNRIEAYGTADARTIATQWHPTYRLPTLITETGRSTSFTYDPNGNLLTRTVTDTSTSKTRTWTYTYNAFGQVLTEDGPRTDVNDVTIYTYYNCATGYECGQLATITDPLGHVTTFNTYNGHGQPLTVTDANGVLTTFTYDLRQRLKSSNTAGELTQFSYFPTGLLQQITFPDGSYLIYSYDAAQRLTQIADAAGNHIVYTLDATGNRIGEQVYDPSNALARAHSRAINSLNQLTADINAANTSSVTTAYTYDAKGNLSTISAPLSHNTQLTYDALDRLTQTMTTGGSTHVSYDTNNTVTSIIDPRNLQTTYQRDAFGDLVQQMSPDTGTTANSFDDAGNLLNITDARNQSASYTYDALNRLVQITYGDQLINLNYDLGANAIGRLNQIIDGSGSTTYSYTEMGRVASKTQNVGAISLNVNYGYNTTGQLTTLMTPSGQTVQFGYTNNQITSVTVNGNLVLNGVTYAPFGPTTGWTWSNGATASRTYDADGHLIKNSDGGSVTFSYNADGTIAARSEDTGVGPALSPGATTLAVAGTSNQLSSASGALSRTYTYDVAGHVTGDGVHTFTYNAAGRLASATSGGVTTNYSYNAMGQRVLKSNSSSSTYFVYDETGHLLGEYDVNGTLIQELVWLGDIPVATIRTDQGGAGVGVFYIHTDNLNAPTAITRPADNVVIWRWPHDAYGNGLPNEDPDGNSLLLTFNMRFPGQYFDSETGLLYNTQRDYDALTGRYIESDPLGLSAGINTYSYAGGNPLSNADPSGLECLSIGALTLCSYPGGPKFVLPRPKGFPDVISSDEDLYHQYDVKSPIGCANPQDVMQELINNPTPGQPDPATHTGTYNNAPALLFRTNPVTSYLTTDLNTGAPLVVNVTNPDSAFAPGYVARTVRDGVAHSYGEGLNAWQSPKRTTQTVQDIGNWWVWKLQMDELVKRAKGKCGCQ